MIFINEKLNFIQKDYFKKQENEKYVIPVISHHLESIIIFCTQNFELTSRIKLKKYQCAVFSQISNDYTVYKINRVYSILEKGKMTARKLLEFQAAINF